MEDLLRLTFFDFWYVAIVAIPLVHGLWTIRKKRQE